MNNINAVETIRSILDRKGLFYQENIAFFIIMWQKTPTSIGGG